jgi:ligand-binding sensor domain-containing protein
MFLHHGGLLFATGENISIEDYSYKDGLKTSWVFSVYKDSKGFLWICSNNGLFRYDGYNFRNVNTMIKDFFNLETYCITEDANNNFLIGTPNGLYFYNTLTERIFQLQLNIDKKTKIYQIFPVNNKIFLASTNGLLFFGRQKTYTPGLVIQTRVLLPDSLHKRTPQDNIINSLYHSPGSHSLWVGTNGALYELDLNRAVR